jgi:SSS family solute:Na+ symporter
MKAVLTNFLFDMPLIPLLYFIGVALFAYYQLHPDPNLPENADQVFPYFVGTHLPVGLSGLFLAALLAGTQSSVDSGINSLSASCVVDWYKGLIRPNATEAQCLRLGKVLTLAWGLFATITAIFYEHLGPIYLSVSLVLGFFMGPLIGIFLIGMLSTRARSSALWPAALLALAGQGIWYDFTKNWLVLPAIGVVVTMGVTWLVSQAFPRKPDKDLTGLTCWTRPNNP